MIEEKEFCDIVDCPNDATVIIGRDGKKVCYLHAIQYQRDLADRMNRKGDTLL